ncbi:hypothetical protein [Leuconostoc pseudomesenteroides]|nr:hypothetical protein [Leuconostoc pseudomesenteroides]
MEEKKRTELASQIVEELKQKDLLETEAISVLRGAMSQINDLMANHKLG